MQKKKKNKNKKRVKNYPIPNDKPMLLTQVPATYNGKTIPEIEPMILREQQYEKTIAHLKEALTTSQKQITTLIGMLAQDKKL